MWPHVSCSFVSTNWVTFLRRLRFARAREANRLYYFRFLSAGGYSNTSADPPVTRRRRRVFSFYASQRLKRCSLLHQNKIPIYVCMYVARMNTDQYGRNKNDKTCMHDFRIQ